MKHTQEEIINALMVIKDECLSCNGDSRYEDSCFFSRIVVSENGFHPLCGLPSQKAVKCLTGHTEYYKAVRKETANK